MKVAHKLTLAMTMTTTLVIGTNAGFRLREELRLVQADIRADHHRMGLGLRAAIGQIWNEDGEQRALWLVDRANEREGSVLIRWVWLNLAQTDVHGPRAPSDVLAVVSRGEEAQWVDENGGRWYTYIPLDVPGASRGALEISESLDRERSQTRRVMVRAVIVTVAVVILSMLMSFVLGSWIVGRPVRAIIEKTRQIGAGNLGSDLTLDSADEFSEISAEINAMCTRLTAIG